MRRVLLVDDSSEIRMIVRMCLHGSEYHLDETEDAATALNRIARQTYDAILLDVDLPGMDGPACATEIRKLGGRWAVIPIIALTGHTDDEVIRRCIDAGYTQYISKPVRKEAILQTLKESIPADAFILPIALDSVATSAPVDPDIQDLVPGFLSNRKRDVGLGREALVKGDFAELRRIGHNLKGTGPTYGFPALGAIGARIEKEAKAGDARLLEQSINELESLLSQLVT
jgi:CheY-like chemotaxis protein